MDFSRRTGFILALSSILAAAFYLGFVVTAASPASGGPQQTWDRHPHSRFVRADQILWQPAADLPPGAQVAVLEGDPAKPGLVILRLKMPDGYIIPPVWHPATDRFTVLAGVYHMGVGPAFDRKNAVALAAGDFAWLSSSAPHYGWAEGETILEVAGLGPFLTRYVNPKDDPRKN